jgi:hypothetical protein
LRANSATVAPGNPPSRPREKVVMFATTCSKPEVMKTITHAKIMTSRAPSLRSRAADQIARHTRRLHRTPRKKSC